jgi:trehalose/maltose hydrolase-like predicted phosphorylase
MNENILDPHLRYENWILTENYDDEWMGDYGAEIILDTAERMF